MFKSSSKSGCENFPCEALHLSWATSLPTQMEFPDAWRRPNRNELGGSVYSTSQTTPTSCPSLLWVESVWLCWRSHIGLGPSLETAYLGSTKSRVQPLLLQRINTWANEQITLSKLSTGEKHTNQIGDNTLVIKKHTEKSNQFFW